jgi:glycosyltransferase involved in cell wall biosynthesis
MQAHADWEIVVSDNASEADIVGYVRSLGDNRIRARRVDTLIPVTENWNAALEQAKGDYFVMLGDDDALMPGALARMAALIDAWRRPEAIYVQAVQYGYPNVIAEHPDPFLQISYNPLVEARSEPFAVERETATRLVRGAMDFRVLYGYNMQHFVISRALVERLRNKGPFFQSPYPDYYAANAVLLAADTLVATPEVLTLIGISPKSFGFYYFNRREHEGVEFLRNVPGEAMRERLRRIMVPGTNMNDSWLCAMETLSVNFPERADLRVGYRRYRLLQYFATLHAKSIDAIATVLRHARWWEMLLYALPALAYAVSYLLPGRYGRRVRYEIWAPFSAYPRLIPRRDRVSYTNILEAARALGKQGH